MKNRTITFYTLGPEKGIFPPAGEVSISLISGVYPGYKLEFDQFGRKGVCIIPKEELEQALAYLEDTENA